MSDHEHENGNGRLRVTLGDVYAAVVRLRDDLNDLKNQQARDRERDTSGLNQTAIKIEDHENRLRRIEEAVTKNTTKLALAAGGGGVVGFVLTAVMNGQITP